MIVCLCVVYGHFHAVVQNRFVMETILLLSLKYLLSGLLLKECAYQLSKSLLYTNTSTTQTTKFKLPCSGVLIKNLIKLFICYIGL